MNGFRIIDRHHSELKVPSAREQSLKNQELDTIAFQWARMRIGDQQDLAKIFLAKVASIRKCSTEAESLEDKLEEIRGRIVLQQPLDLHDQKSLDLQRIMQLL